MKKHNIKPSARAGVVDFAMKPIPSYIDYLVNLSVLKHSSPESRPVGWKKYIARINIKHCKEEHLFLYWYIKQPHVNSDYIDFLNFLIENGADFSLLSAHTDEFIEYACYSEQPILLRWLLEDRQLKIGTGQSLHPLGYAFMRKNHDVRDYLIEKLPYYSNNGDTALLIAVRFNYKPIFTWLVQQKQHDINQANMEGVTPLMLAVMLDRHHMVESLLELGASLHAKTIKGLSVFHLALHYSDSKYFLELLDHPCAEAQGININTVMDNNGSSLLHWVIREIQSIDLIRTMIDVKHANPHVTHFSAKNLAIFSCLVDLPEIAQFLIETYALDIQAKDDQGFNVLHHCILNDAKCSAEWLLKNYSTLIDEQTKNGNTALMLAAIHNNDFFIHFLLKHGGRVNAINNAGFSFGHILAGHNKHELVGQMIREEKCDLSMRDYNGQTLLDVALMMTPPRTETIRVCINFIKEHNRVSHQSEHISFKIVNNYPDLLLFLCRDDVLKVDQFIEDGQTALHLGCAIKNKDFLRRFLTEFKFDINQPSQHGNTPLFYIAKHQSTQTTAWFCNVFAPSLYSLDSLDSSLLHIACEQQSISLVTWCVSKKKLSVLQPRADGVTAFDIALSQRNLELVIYLWEALTSKERLRLIAQYTQLAHTDQIMYLVKHGLYEIPQAVSVSTEAKPEVSDGVVACIETEHGNEEHMTSAASVEVRDNDVDDETPYVDSKMILDAIKAKKSGLIKQLKHRHDLAEVLSLIAEEVMVLAISQQYYPVVYHVLRVTVFYKHFIEQNQRFLLLSKTINNSSIHELLKKIASTEDDVEIDTQMKPPIYFLDNTHESDCSVNLPWSIKSIFSSFQRALSSDRQAYLVGSTIHTLMRGMQLDSNHDLDFVIEDSPSNKLCEETYFYVSAYGGGRLYTGRVGGFEVDVRTGYASDETQVLGCFLSYDVLSRDFTAFAIYCNKQGILFDPTKRGIDDFKNKILHTVQSATLSFQQDPVRLLRAIKYIILGYTPTEEVQAALHAWVPQSNIQFRMGHIHAHLRKYLSLSSGNEFFKIFCDYNLHTKLFDFSECDTQEKNLLRLRKLLKLERDEVAFFQPLESKPPSEPVLGITNEL